MNSPLVPGATVTQLGKVLDTKPTKDEEMAAGRDIRDLDSGKRRALSLCLCSLLPWPQPTVWADPCTQCSPILCQFVLPVLKTNWKKKKRCKPPVKHRADRISK